MDTDQTASHGMVSMAILKKEVREQQRRIDELRGEVEFYRKELASARVARARMEGQIRETERRYAEARQIVELQREELARIRQEREKVLSSGRQLQEQMHSLQRQLASLGSTKKRRKAAKAPVARTQKVLPKKSDKSTTSLPVPSVSTQPASNVRDEASSAMRQEMQGQEFVAVQSGDTLWSLARRYGVDLLELRALNGLRSDLIFPGQALMMPGGPSSGQE